VSDRSACQGSRWHFQKPKLLSSFLFFFVHFSYLLMSQLRKTWLSKPLEGALADASAINARADHALLSDPKIRENNHLGQPANSGNSINAFKRIDKDAPRRQGWRTEAPLDGRPNTLCHNVCQNSPPFWHRFWWSQRGHAILLDSRSLF
jgi:hypothetical protein